MLDYDVILSFLTAFALTYVVIPPTIRVAVAKGLYDVPGQRRSHTQVTPRLGGVAIYAGVVFAIIFWTPFDQYGDAMQYILTAFVLIFLVGVKDDIDGLAASTKLVAEVLAAMILVFKCDLRIESLSGIMGIYELPYWWSVVLTIFTIIVIINSLNLIDGINGLSGSITLLVTGLSGSWFLMQYRYDLAILAFSTAGAVMAFLKYNFTPARIFMGDTGALLNGLIISILVIKFLQLNEALPDDNPYQIATAPAMAFGLLILPLFDTLRVFTLRILQGRNPLHADRNHIHHLLLDSGLSHMQATGVLVVVNIVFVVLTFMLQRYTNRNLVIICFLLGLACLMAGALAMMLRRRQRILARRRQAS
ncbi:MAG: undecaprenyl-phosphate alpha-N-acetylglucosaminyl 1-phosphate transferase [Saprospiraceae bacterium]|nr:MAG: undecaprenyl-phosphate alpha-N-acetylglucosaminyl 1-phosphate transferase [Saprospiraceae bacterium]